MLMKNEVLPIGESVACVRSVPCAINETNAILSPILMSSPNRIAAEQREAERRRREAIEEERDIAFTKMKLKQESTQVLLGVSAKCCTSCSFCGFFFFKSGVSNT